MLFEIAGSKIPADQSVCRAANHEQRSTTGNNQKKPLYRLYYFGFEHNYAVIGKFAEYCRKESSTIEITHQSNIGQRAYNVFWLRTFGLESWCVETELNQAQILALLERAASRIRLKHSPLTAAQAQAQLF